MCRYKMSIEMEYGVMNINLGDIYKEALEKYNKVKSDYANIPCKMKVEDTEKKQVLFIKENKELLQTVFIISNLEVEENQRTNEEKLGVKIEQAEGEKCERCWMYSTTVGEDKENPTICHRCSEALK